MWMKRPRIPGNHPPIVRAKIPWLGHAMSLLKDESNLVKHARLQYPKDGIIALPVAGRLVYLVTNNEVASQIYRQTRNFAFDPLALRVSSAFGCNSNDMKILEEGTLASPQKVNPNQQTRPGILTQFHRMTAEHLMGDSLHRMTSIFVEYLASGISEMFPENDENSFEWQDIELVDFVKKQWTKASIISMFGTNIFKVWPEIDEWIWRFDPQVTPLMTKLPKVIYPHAHQLREEGLNRFIAWEREAKENYSFTDERADWDVFWGLKFLKMRAALAEEYGLSERGRAAIQLSLFWGQNANAIPIATWLCVKALTTPNVLSSIMPELKASMNNKNKKCQVNFLALFKQPHLCTLLLETYRWSTSSPTVRVVQEDTQVGRYALLKDNIVIIHGRSLQMDTTIWTSSAPDFDTQRFLSSDAEKKKKRLQALRHFGGGQNLCPGRHFASNEILGGFALLMNLLEFDVPQDELLRTGMPKVDLSEGKQGGLWPDRGLMVRVRRRRG
ncbi:Cholesterol 7-alpha-monooxygenase 4 [Phlyctema vagabunda]|uniref:Cholesterol 7-alpha-monooxygenase 4 n=1 Tax=Phlyctema vagabunda TaxID=108571 RepID=A0ABR4PPG7_9HELO